jgi:hypothetical protein
MFDFRVIYDALGFDSSNYSRDTKKILKPYLLNKHYFIEKVDSITTYLLPEPFFIVLAYKVNTPNLKDFLISQNFTDKIIVGGIKIVSSVAATEDHLTNFLEQMEILSNHTRNIASGYKMVSEFKGSVQHILEKEGYVKRDKDLGLLPTDIGVPHCQFRIIQSVQPKAHLVWKETFITALVAFHKESKMLLSIEESKETAGPRQTFYKIARDSNDITK